MHHLSGQYKVSHFGFGRTVITAMVLAGLLVAPGFAAVLSSAPIQLSDYGMQQDQELGWSLALSADGQVAAGGAVGYNRAGTSSTDYTGAAYVYVRTGGTWSSAITLSTTGIPTGSFIGSAMAVSPDGQQVIVGAQYATSQGGVYLYNETGGNWTNTPTRTGLTLPTNMVGTAFGEGLAVSSNGQTLLVGARPASASSTGEIYAYSLSGGNWGSPVALPMTGIPNGLDMGGVLAASANGQVVVAGGPQWNTAEGAAYVWTQNANGSWNNPVELAYPSSLDKTLSYFGGAVAISADGTEIVVGATGANNNVGAAYIYVDANGTWSATPKMLSTTMSNAGDFGSSVALSPDGLTAFVGMAVSDTGYVFISTQTSGTWSTPTTLSTANLPVSAFLGIHLAQADNGEELLTTGENVNNITGALFVYDSPAAITLKSSASAPSVTPGSSLTFDLTLTNADQPGSTAATTLNSVILTDTLPSGATYVSSNAANGACSQSGGTVTCTLTSLAPGNNSQNPWTPSITVNTSSTAAVLNNTVTVSSNEPLVGSTTTSTQVTNDVVPTVTNGGVATTPGTAVSGTLAATPGYSGQKLTFTIVSQPSHATVKLTNTSTGAFTYTPASGFSGTDGFAFNVGDGIVTSGTGIETVTVGSGSSSAPVANNQSLTDYENQPLAGQLSATSSSGHSLTYTAASQPAHGSVTVTASTGAFTYTPASGYTGSDSFTFTANDGTGTSNTATVSITISPIPSQGGAPVAGGESLNDYAGQALSGTLVAVSPSGKTLTYTAASQPAHGSVVVTASTGAFTYTPSSGFTGSDSFTFTASDGTSTSNTASVSITVLATPATSGGGSTSSGKSGGGGLGFPALLLFIALLITLHVRKRRARLNTIAPLTQERTMPRSNTQAALRTRHVSLVATACAALTFVFSISSFAAVLSSAPVQLSDNGMQENQLLGWSLALSANGQVAAGGAVAYNRAGIGSTDYTGAAYVYTQSNGVWGAPITLSTTGIATGGEFGTAIAVSANGQQVLVGASNLSSYTGAVYVYTEANGSWANTPTRVALTLPTGVTSNYSFGSGLAVSADGQTLIVGATRAASGSTSPGGLYAYTLSGTTWGNPVALPMTGIPNGAFVGGSIAVSANGGIVVAGAPQQNKAQGAVYVWVKSGGTWGNPAELALPSTLGPAGTLSFLGTAVAISADGTEVLAGATGASFGASYTGAAYVYTHSGSGWSTTPVMLKSGLANSNTFGQSVALSPDGNSAFIGMPYNSTGYVYMATLTNGTWSAPVALSVANLPPQAGLGQTLAAADNGEELLTSGETANSGIGQLFVYDSPAAITLAASASAPSVAPGSSLTFDLTLTNADQPGSTAATTLNSVILTDTLPSGATYVSSNAANGNCSNSGGTVTCTLTSLAPGNNSQNPWTPSITVKTSSTAAVLNNTVTVSSNEPLVGSTSVNTQVTNDVTPAAVAGGVATTPGTAVSGTLSATPGFSGQSLTFAVVTPPGNGTLKLTNASTGAFTYTPNTGFNGTDVFIFNVGDGVVTSNSAAEVVTVSTTKIVPPVANDQTLSAVEGQTLDGQLSATSSNGHSLTYAATSQPVHGTLDVTGSTGAFTYTPTSGFSGSDSFTFTANDGTSTSNTATVSITISPIPSQGGAPVAGGESLNDYAGQALSGTLVAVSPSGKTLTYTAASQPAHGSVVVTASTGAFTYTPSSGFTGSDSFTFTASDGTSTSNTASVSITVLATPATSGGGSTSSGKSGGGGLGFPALLLFIALLITLHVRKRRARLNTIAPLTQERTMPRSNTQAALRTRHVSLVATACAALTFVFSISGFAAVLSSAPVQLSFNGMQQSQLLGWSLALSADGQVAAGGAPSYNRAAPIGTDYTGAAYVYTQSNGVWGAPITLSTTGIATGGQFGNAIAISANGQQVLVGAPDLASYTGAVYAYTEANGSWANTPTRVTLTLPADVTTDYSFGMGLAVSADGQTLIVGASHTIAAGKSPGNLYAYTLSGTTWGNPVALPMTGIPTGDFVGGSIAVSANGAIVVAGAKYQNSNQGAVYVWTKSGGTWGSPVELAVPSGLNSGSALGSSVAISADGTEVLAGATGASFGASYTGAAYVYTHSGSGWSTTPAMLESGLANSNTFGQSVALSPDGNTAFIGMPYNDTGYVYMATLTNDTWSAPVALSVANLPPKAFLGDALATADNGEEVLTSGETANSDIGQLFAYESPATITLASSASAPSVAPGSSLTFDLTLTNADQPGSTAATTLNSVILTDTLPAGVTYVSSNAANGNCSNSGGTVTCTLTSLAPGNNSQNPWTPSITVKTSSTAAVLNNTVTVSSNEPLVGSTTISTKVTNDVVPTAVNGGVTTLPGQAGSGTLTVTPGYSGQKLTFAIQSPPAHGTVTLTNAATGAFTYTPVAGFTGTDAFIFSAGDGVVTSNAAPETITVSTTQTTPPVANNQTLTDVEGQTLQGQLSATSSNGHSLTYAATNQPAHGTLSVTNSTGAFTYTPTSGFSGTDTFTFTANDGTNTSNSATVSITVQADSTSPTNPTSPTPAPSKSGGGGTGFPGLLLLGGLLLLVKQRRRLPSIHSASM